MAPSTPKKSEVERLDALMTAAAQLKGGKLEVGFQYLCDAAKLLDPWTVHENGHSSAYSARGWTQIALDYARLRSNSQRHTPRLYRGMKDITTAYVHACLAWGIRHDRCVVDVSCDNANVSAYTVLVWMDEEMEEEDEDEVEVDSPAEAEHDSPKFEFGLDEQGDQRPPANTVRLNRSGVHLRRVINNDDV